MNQMRLVGLAVMPDDVGLAVAVKIADAHDAERWADEHRLAVFA
jgi:hypothetical protein